MDITELQAQVRGTVLTADDADYDQVRAMWNGMVDA